MSDDQLHLIVMEQEYEDHLTAEGLVRIPPAVEAVLHDDWPRKWVQASVPLLSGRRVPVACLFDVYHVCCAVQMGADICEASLSYRTFERDEAGQPRQWEHGYALITHTARVAVVTNRWQYRLRDRCLLQEFRQQNLIRLEQPART